ncbi:MAG: DUF4249 domain-containing protein [Bacteroidota bacterium]
MKSASQKPVSSGYFYFVNTSILSSFIKFFYSVGRLINIFKSLKSIHTLSMKDSNNLIKNPFLLMFYLLMGLLGFIGCTEEYDIDFHGHKNVLIVEGLLTDDNDNLDTIKIYYSNDTNKFVKKVPIAFIQCVIQINSSGEQIKLIEKGIGKFLLPSNFKLFAGEVYTLKFILPNNERYESTAQELVATPPISNVYEKFNPQSIYSDVQKKLISANEVFVDFQDNINQKNFYLWRYIHFERIPYCQAYYTASAHYGIPCEKFCIDKIRSQNINISSDVLSNGRLVTGKFAAKIPYYNPYGCLIEVQHMCISPDVYQFNKILESQTQVNGGLADTPAEPLSGNIRNTNNAKEIVIGYFGVANVQKKRFWIDRNDASGNLENYYGSSITPFPVSPSGISNVFPCIESQTRIASKPEGWQ